ncbi:hypothetical protein [Streptomyces sp. NPDC053427]|uniref:hypothetical protein n=1 Tax=Streptomyces sp. NPDC053427 TaxID=3365701 RepID=UPI0037D265A3
MSYQLDAVIGDFDRLRSRAAGDPEALVAPLHQRMGLMPLTKAHRDELPQTLGRLSQGGPIAHVEADFWAGDGCQTASLWRAGVREWGPAHTSTFTGPQRDWPINAALARLGVAPAGPGAPDHCDLFEVVGLGSGRDEDDWHLAARQADWAADYDEWHARRAAAHEREERAAAERARHERLPDVPVAMDGRDVMDVLGTPPGRTVAAAIRHLQELHLARGPLPRAQAEAALRTWAAEHDPTTAPDS